MPPTATLSKTPHLKSLGAHRRRRQLKACRSHPTSRVGEPASGRTFGSGDATALFGAQSTLKPAIGYLGRLAANRAGGQRARSIHQASARPPSASVVQPLGTPANHSRSSRLALDPP